METRVNKMLTFRQDIPFDDGMQTRMTSKTPAAKAIIVFAAGVLLTLLFTWPFASKLGKYYLDFGDYPLNGWILWSNPLIHHGPAFSSNEFYPYPYSIAYFDHLFVPSLMFAPLYALTHNLILSVNFFAFMTFALSFAAAFYAIYYFARDGPASAVGAAIYAFNPMIFAHFASGHLNLMNRCFLPLVFVFAYRYFREPGWKIAALFFLFFTLNALSVVYFGVFTVIMLPIFLVPFLVKYIRRRENGKLLGILKYAALALLFAPILVYSIIPYYQFYRKEGLARSVAVTEINSARPIDWISANRDNFLYGGFTRGILGDKLLSVNPAEHTLFLNVLPSLLFILGLFALRRSRSQESGLVWDSHFLILAVSFVLSFGPVFMGWGWSANGGGPNLPYYYLYQLSPVLDGDRTPARFQFVFYIPFALFAAYGAKALLDKIRMTRGIAAFVLLFLIFLENFNFRTYSATSAVLPSFEKEAPRLAFLRGNVTLHLPTYVPIFYNAESRYLSINTLLDDRMVNCDPSSFSPVDMMDFLLRLSKRIGPDALAGLKASGVRYIVVHKDFLKRDFHQTYIGGPGTVFEDENVSVLDLDRLPSHPVLCSIRDDFAVIVRFPPVALGGVVHYSVTLANRGDCYLSSRFEDQYIPVDIRLNGKRYSEYLALPFLIGPREQETLLGQIPEHPKWFNGIGKGTYDAQLDIPRIGFHGAYRLQMK